MTKFFGVKKNANILAIHDWYFIKDITNLYIINEDMNKNKVPNINWKKNQNILPHISIPNLLQWLPNIPILHIQKPDFLSKIPENLQNLIERYVLFLFSPSNNSE